MSSKANLSNMDDLTNKILKADLARKKILVTFRSLKYVKYIPMVYVPFYILDRLILNHPVQRHLTSQSTYVDGINHFLGLLTSSNYRSLYSKALYHKECLYHEKIIYDSLNESLEASNKPKLYLWA